MRILGSLALFCGAVPLIAGISILGAFYVTRCSTVAEAGLYLLIYAGPAAFVVGVASLAVVACLGRKRPSSSRLSRSALASRAVLLLTNIPAGVACLALGMYRATEYTLTVRNASGQPVTAVVATGGDVSQSYGTLQTGESKRRRFHFRNEGQLVCSARVGGRRATVVADGYVCNGLGGGKLVVIQPGGNMEVSDTRGSDN